MESGVNWCSPEVLLLPSDDTFPVTIKPREHHLIWTSCWTLHGKIQNLALFMNLQYTSLINPTLIQPNLAEIRPGASEYSAIFTDGSKDGDRIAG